MQLDGKISHYVCFSSCETDLEPKNVEPEKCKGWQLYDINHLPKNLTAITQEALKLFLKAQSSKIA
jgi:hypothetical protein